MKKIISAVLIIAMAASMAACGDSSKADESGGFAIRNDDGKDSLLGQ